MEWNTWSLKFIPCSILQHDSLLHQIPSIKHAFAINIKSLAEINKNVDRIPPDTHFTLFSFSGTLYYLPITPTLFQGENAVRKQTNQKSKPKPKEMERKVVSLLVSLRLAVSFGDLSRCCSSECVLRTLNFLPSSAFLPLHWTVFIVHTTVQVQTHAMLPVLCCNPIRGTSANVYRKGNKSVAEMCYLIIVIISIIATITTHAKEEK